MVGATIGAVVCIAVALLATRLWPTTVLVAVFFVAYQQLENYVLAPRIMRRPVQFSPAAVLLAGLIGGTALGLVGALMAIPIAAGLKVLLNERLEARDAADTGAADTDAARPHGCTRFRTGYSQSRCAVGAPSCEPDWVGR